MAFYHISLAGSLAINAGLAYHKHKATPSPLLLHKASDESPQQACEGYESDSDWSTTTANDWAVTSRQYLTVYGLAAAADWLQVSRAKSQLHQLWS